jgi:cell division protein YceG involved in septum cleavage
VRGAAAALLLAAACAGAPGEPVQVTIPKGASFRAITDSLRAHGIIEHPTFFRVLARLRRLDRSVKAGTYRLPQGSSSWNVIDALQRGDQLLVKVTLPPCPASPARTRRRRRACCSPRPTWCRRAPTPARSRAS